MPFELNQNNITSENKPLDDYQQSIKKAKSLLSKNLYDEALEELKKAWDINESAEVKGLLAQALTHLAKTSEKNKDYIRADEYYLEILEFDENKLTFVKNKRARLVCKIADQKIAEGNQLKTTIDWEFIESINKKIKKIEESGKSKKVIADAFKMIMNRKTPDFELNISANEITNAIKNINQIKMSASAFQEALKISKTADCGETSKKAFQENAQFLNFWLFRGFPVSEIILLLKGK